MENKKMQDVINLVQPNKVTNAKYSFTEREENILTMIISNLQKYMSRDQELSQDLFGNPMLTVNMNDLPKGSRKSDYVRSAKNMIRKTFSFEWKHPDSLQNVESEGVLITTVHNYPQSAYFQLTINPWAIQYLLYWGKGVGGTIFERTTALRLRGEYTKRMYKLCKRFEDRGGFTMSLTEFRTMLGLEDKYKTVSNLRIRVLDAARNNLMKDADIYFTYAFEKLNGAREFNNINFHIESNNVNLKVEDKTDVYLLVYNVINIAYPNSESTRARDFSDRLATNPDKLKKVYMRFKKIQADYYAKEKTANQTIPLIKHILKEDYNLS